MEFIFGQKSAAGQLALAFPLLLTCMLAVALLGPLLVSLTAWLARPLGAVGGAPARLALAAIAAQPRRAASAVIPVAMAVAMVGTIYFADTSIQHATATQAASTLTADHVLSASRPTATTLRQVRPLPGVRAAAGMTPVSAGVTDPDLEQAYGEPSRRPARPVAGSRRHLRQRGGAPSRPDRGERTGGRLGRAWCPRRLQDHRVPARRHALSRPRSARSTTVRCPPGTCCIPASVVAGHTGTPPGYSQILVSGDTQPGWPGSPPATPDCT